MPDPREIYFHEDDYCQQQLLPAANFEHSQAELRAISDFARAHEAPGGAGWSDCFVRREAPVPLSSLKIMRHELETAMREVMPAYDVIYSGYSSHRQKCVRTAGWGRSDNCTLFADWDDREVVADIWTMFFEPDEEAIRAAVRAVAAVGRLRPIIYVDWAWGFVCEAHDEEKLANELRAKFTGIDRRIHESKRD